jgi:glycosyltransferase involved in cell wall biosynthesis
MQTSVQLAPRAQDEGDRAYRIVLTGKGPPDRGGISAFLGDLLRTDLASSHDLRLLNLYQEGDRRGGRLTRANVTRTLGDAGRVWRAARDADLVHINTALVPLMTLIRAGVLTVAGRLAGARVLVHVHSGMVEPWLAAQPRRWLARLALCGANSVVTVSNGTHDALQVALGATRVKLIYNGVDIAAFDQGPPHNPPRIVFAGVLTPRKGVVDLLQASRLLRDRGVHHELLLAGGTPEEGARVEAEVRREAGTTAPAARFLGPQPHEDMPGLYRRADVFCLPSWWEAMPLTVLEAMAAGLPVVATPVGDIARMVEDGVTGRLVAPHRPEALADALEPLLRDVDLRRAMGRAARRSVSDHFDLGSTAAALDTLYREMLR